MLDKIILFIKLCFKFFKLNEVKKWEFFSYILVPIFIAFYWLNVIETFNPITGLNNKLTIYPLSTQIDKSHNESSKKGVVVLINGLKTEFAVPIENDSSSIWLSLDKENLKMNRNKIELNENSLKISPNILGFSNPYAVIVEGKLNGKILFPGVTSKIKDFYPEPINNNSLLIWIFIASIFGFGLIIPSFNRNIIGV